MKWNFGKILRHGLAALLLACLCTACLYSRLLSFKNQLKSFDRYVVLTQDGTTLQFLKPVVKPDDLSDLTGLPPTEMNVWTNGQQEHRYIYRSLSESTGTPCTLCFKFGYQSKGLSSFEYPASIMQVLGTNLIVSAAKAVGKSRLIQSEYKLDWASLCTNLTAELVPSVADMTEVFGPAQSRSNSAQSAFMNYAFALEPSKTAPWSSNATLQASFQFDADNELLRHGEISMGKLKMVVELPRVTE
jgi:hypothetical protein